MAECLWPMAHGLWRMCYGLRDPDLPLSEHCKPILPPGGDRGLGCLPGVPRATHKDTGPSSALQPVLATEGSARTAPHPPGYTSPGGALGSTQGGFSVLFSQHCKPIGSLAGTVA